MKRLLVLAIGLAACSGSGSSSSPCADLGVDMGDSCVIRPASPAVRLACGADGLGFDFCDSAGVTTPNLACLPGTTSTVASSKVTMTGFVHAFANGPDTNHVSVAILDGESVEMGGDPSLLTAIAEDDICFYFTATAQCSGATAAEADAMCATGICLDSGFCAPDAFTDRSCLLANADPTVNDLIACDVDPTIGCSVPKTDTCSTACADGLNGRRDQQMYCHTTSDGTGACRPRARWEVRYTLTGVPSDEQLVIRVTGEDGLADANWAATITYDAIATTQRLCNFEGDTDCFVPPDAAKMQTVGTYQRDLFALSQTDHAILPQRAGLTSGVPEGDGAVIGEVHDCDGVRIGNAQITTSPDASRISYFSDKVVADPLPDVTRAALGTDPRGLYGAFDIVPGLVTITPWGFVSDGAPLETLGSITVRVFPDTYTFVDLGGGRLGQ